MKRVIVIGCPGSGKSTFARKLTELTGLPLVHLDMIWHKPDRTTVSREFFDRELDKVLMSEKWIIDGNYSRTLLRRMQRCDTVFLFDLPTEICLEGVARRIGMKRPDMPWIENTFDDDFREWIINFRRVRLPEIESILSARSENVRLITFRSRHEADSYLKNLGANVGETC